MERPRLGGVFLSIVRPSYVVRRRRGDRFFQGTLFQDRRAGINNVFFQNGIFSSKKLKWKLSAQD